MNAQRSLFYDAVFLKNRLEQSPTHKISLKSDVVILLKEYYPATDINNIDTTLLKANPFLKDMFEASSGQGDENYIGKALSASIGGLNVTTYVNALSNIMIKHAKEELTVAFFDRFKKLAKAYPEFGVLFPKTSYNLENLLSYKYPEMLPTLRTGYFEDIKQITLRLDNVLELPEYRELLKNFPEVKVTIRSLKLIQEIESGASNAADVIKEFSGLPEWKDSTSTSDFRNMGNTVKLAAIFSESFRNINQDSIWISPKQVKALVSDPAAFRIYLGLIYEKIANENLVFDFKQKDSEKYTTISVTSLMAQNKDELILFQSKTEEFILLASQAESAFHDIRQNKNISTDDAYRYINTSIDLIDYSFGIASLFDQRLNAGQYIAIAKQSNNLYKAVSNKQYNQAMTDAFDILLKLHDLIEEHTLQTNGTNLANSALLKTIKNDSQRNNILKITKGDDFLSRVKNKNIDSAKIFSLANPKNNDLKKLIAYYDSKNTLEKLSDFIEKIRPYALFMANVVTAENGEDVESAIENAILPVGSSSIKKYSNFNISVQSYLGAFGNTTGTKQTNQSSWHDKFGVTAPVGLSFSYGLKKAGSISLFGSILDIGAIVDYKLTSDSISGSGQTGIKKEYTINLGQIVAPGGYIVWGLPWNLPLSLGFGTQYGPGLSSIDISGQTVINNPTWRWSVFLCVDIPFVNIINKPKRSE